MGREDRRMRGVLGAIVVVTIGLLVGVSDWSWTKLLMVVIVGGMLVSGIIGAGIWSGALAGGLGLLSFISPWSGRRWLLPAAVVVRALGSFIRGIREGHRLPAVRSTEGTTEEICLLYRMTVSTINGITSNSGTERRMISFGRLKNERRGPIVRAMLRRANGMAQNATAIETMCRPVIFSPVKAAF